MDRIQWVMSLIDRLSAPARRMEAATRAVKAAQEAAAKQSKKLGAALAALASPSRIASSAMHGVRTAVLTAFGVGAVALGGAAAVGAGMKAIIDAAGYKEQQLVGFTTMLGDAGKASRLYAAAVKFADATPFETPDVLDVTKKMLAFQFTTKQIPRIMTAAGDAVSSLGGGAAELQGLITAFGQIRAKGKLSAEELNQFAERGIPAVQFLAKTLKTNTAGALELVAKGAVSAEVAITSITEGMEKAFGGGMAKQAKTIFGLVSTLKSRPFALFTSLDQGGAIEPVRKLLDNLANLTDFSKSPGNKIQAVFQRSVGNLFKVVFGNAADMTSRAKGEQLVLGIIGWIDKATMWLQTEGPKVVQTVKQIFSGIAGAVGTIVQIAKVLAPFTPAIIAFFVAFKAVQGIIVAVQAIQMLIGAFGILKAVLPLVGGPWGLLIAAIAAGVVYVIANWKKFQPAIQPIINWFGVAIGKVKTFFSSLPAFFAGLWTRVTTIFNGAVAFLARFPFLPIGAVAWLIQNFNQLPMFFSNLWANVTGIFNGAIAFLARFPVTPLGALAWLIQNWNNLPAAFSSIWATVQGVFNGAMAWFAGLPARFMQFGANIILGIRDGILGALGQVKAAIEGAANSAIGWFKGALGIASPSKVFMGAGQEIGAGAARGITSSLPMVSKAMRVLTATTALATGVMAKPVQNPVKKMDNPSRVVQTVAKASEIDQTPKSVQVAKQSNTPKIAQTAVKPVQVLPKPVQTVVKPVQATPKPVQAVSKTTETTKPPKTFVPMVAKTVQATPKPVQTAARVLETVKTPKVVQTAQGKPVQAIKAPVTPQPVPMATRVKAPAPLSQNANGTSSSKIVNLTVKIEGSPSTDKATLETYKALTVEALTEVLELQSLEVRGGN